MKKPNKNLPDLKMKPSSAVPLDPALTKSESQSQSQSEEENMFKKREGTAGISGHLFETKLLSLLYFRAIHDDRIKKFQLASNVDNMGAFDDICFQAEVEDFDRPVLVLIQAKHRENKNQTLKIDFPTYFISYLKVIQQFDQCNKGFFKGEFDETECLFVLYTTARDESSSDSKVESNFFSILNDLIGTGGTAKQPNKLDEDVERICKATIKQQMISLAERIAMFIKNDGNFQMMLIDEHIQRYHVILAQKAVEVSGIKPGGHRIASFRQSFFDIDDEYLTLFKDTLFEQILKKRKMKSTDVKKILSELCTKPSDASILSKLVGTVVTYNNGQLVFDSKFINDLRPDMKTIDVPRSTYNKAVELAAKEILLSPEFKLRVPAAFGNKDLTLSGDDEKKKKRIIYLSSKITDLLEKSTSSRIVTIDKTRTKTLKGFLELNGGIAGAIGNILVLDDDTKLMKITNNVDDLESLAKSLYERLNNDIELNNKNEANNKILSLSEYKFCTKVIKFPKLSLECEEEVRDFLNKLVIYSNQADEDGLEDILKSEIEEHQLNQPNYLQVHTDAIFSNYHDKMLKWWKLPKYAPILTRDSDFFESVKQSIIKSPLLSVITAMYHHDKIKPFDITFTEDAVSSLNLQNQPSNTVIITENSILTVVKVMQHLKNVGHVVLDMEYIVRLPPNDQKVLRKELGDKHFSKVVVLVCEDLQKNKNKILENIAKTVLDKTTIIVTNNASLKMLQKDFPNPPVHDSKISLINMDEKSQKSILEKARVIFQDREVRLDLIVDEKSKKYVKDDVLIKIVSEETIAVGKLIVKENYNEIKSLHVDRRLGKSGDKIHKVVNTFNDITDDVVLVTAEPGMGKSTLLTHLSIKTKELQPEVWIVRINLLEYSTEFSRWKEENTVIDILEAIKFLCQVILRDKLGKENKVEFTLEEKDNVVCLTHCTADPLTELELNLFLHFYCERAMIFLFDGFDEICPHYMDVVIQYLKCLRDHHKQRMWITSRSYNDIKTVLRQEFGLSFEILYYTNKEMINYLTTFWKNNLNVEKLKPAQLKHVKKFLEYMAAIWEKPVTFSKPLNAVFRIAACYLDFEITEGHNFFEKYSVEERINCDVTPLFLYLSALYVVDNIDIKHCEEEEWYLDVDAFKVYVRFLEIKIKRRYQEKNEMNIHNPDIISAQNKEIKESILNHKKLGAYAIFHKLNSKRFSEKDLEEIKELIKDLEKGEDKTGLIDSVANGYPIFTHMSFTEYFAVEFVCDRLKMASSIPEKVDYSYMMFMGGFAYITLRRIFDHKLKTDKILKSLTEQHKDFFSSLRFTYGWHRNMSD